MDEPRLNPYLRSRMRLLLALLALISGVSATQVVLAASPAEVAGRVLGAVEAADSEQASLPRVAPMRSQGALRKVRVIRLPLVAMAAGNRGYSLSDRPRE